MAQIEAGMIQRAGGWNGFRFKRSAAVAMAGMLAAVPLAFSPVATAHDVVLGSTPENGAVVEEFPDTIELEFSGIPQDLFNTVALSNADTGEILFSGSPELNERNLVIDVPADVETGPGNYAVGFQITSSDGHATKGSIAFEVTGGAADATEASAAASPEPSMQAEEPQATETGIAGLESPWNWLLGGAGVLVIAGAIVMMIAKGRNSK